MAIRSDNKDRMIMKLLQEDGSLSTRAIAERLGGISKMAVSYRIRRLRRAGLIKGFYARIDPEMLGLGYVILVLVTCGLSAAREKEIARQIARFRGVQSVYQTFGPQDIIVVARVRDKEGAQRLLDEIHTVEGVKHTHTIVVYNVVKESLKVDLDLQAH